MISHERRIAKHSRKESFHIVGYKREVFIDGAILIFPILLW
jgi:hypothetical protein